MHPDRDREWADAEKRAEHFTGRQWVFERVRSFLASDASSSSSSAHRGTGKTAVAARLAQGSAGRLHDDPATPVAVDTLAAAVFCRAGAVSLLGVAQDLGDQFSDVLSGFAEEQRRTGCRQVTVSDVAVQTGDVQAASPGSASIWQTLGVTGSSGIGAIVLSIALGLVVAMFASGGLNVMIERVAYKPLRGAPKLAPLITAIGMSFILQNVGLLSRPTPDARPT